MNRFLNGIRHFFEWVTVYAFLNNAYLLLFTHPTFEKVGPLAQFLSSDWSLFIVAIMFLALGMLLAFSKVFKKKKTHTFSLFWTFIVLVYVTVLEVFVSGFGLVLVDNACLLAGIGYSYLRWKIMTEYLNVSSLQAEAERIAHERN